MASCLDTITVEEFKELFYRDFPYIPVWNVATTYNTGDEVVYSVNNLYYRCLQDGVVGGDPSVDTSNWQKDPDIVDKYIIDRDIQKAFTEAKVSFNEALVEGDCDVVKHVFYYLTAHYLVKDIQMSKQGVASSGSYPVTNRTVGSVSESYQVPEMFTKNPIFSYYTTTDYGHKYLQLIYPYTIGNTAAIAGGTQP